MTVLFICVLLYAQVNKVSKCNEYLQDLNKYFLIKTNVVEKLKNYKRTISTSTSLRKIEEKKISKLDIFCNKEIFIAYPFYFLDNDMI